MHRQLKPRERVVSDTVVSFDVIFSEESSRRALTPGFFDSGNEPALSPSPARKSGQGRELALGFVIAGVFF